MRRLTLGPEAAGLEGLARFLLRSEAIASSRIEGLQVSVQQVALFELAAGEGLPTSGFTRNAQLVANNITVLRKAVIDLAAAPLVTTGGIDALHQALLPDERLHGLRTVQNWIGGSEWHPLHAQFVPPPPELVPRLMEDLRAGRHERLAAWRADRGVRERPRSGSAVARLVELLPEVPVMTAGTVQRLLELSFPSARAAVEELADAGVVARRRVERGTTGYLATEVFDLLTYAERRLTSTRWDPRQSKPVRTVPPRPQRRPI